MDRHKVTVIVPTVSRDTLARTEGALARQTRPCDELLIVVDHERRGVAWARNEGIRRATGDLIAITDDDCEPPPDWLERLVRAIDAYDAAGAGGTFQESDPLLDAIRRRQPVPAEEQLDPGGLVGNAGNLMLRRDWLDRCAAADGWVYDERLRSGQDWELVWRLRRHGARLVYVPNPVRHLRRAPLGTYLRHQFRRGVGISWLFRLHRQSDAPIAAQDSLLWGRSDRKGGADWPAIVVRKVLGPFDRRSFDRWSHFLQFWLGEKAQGLGFVWGLWTQRRDARG